MLHKIGFGTYRITYKNREHIDSLIFALQSGVRLIDTSSNYMNGESELAVAIALHEVDESIASEVEIISKFGYMQGDELAQYKINKGYNHTVEYDNSCYHNISAEFMRDQLTKSLSRLHVQEIDCYMIHNPEYFMLDLLNHTKKDDFDKDYMQDEMMQRVFDVFIALEEEVIKGRIKSYGISSNSFSKHPTSLDFMEYESLIDLAREAALKHGKDKHSFTTIELPINLLETDGLGCAAWAKENNLRVLANRPLSAHDDKAMYRLATYDEPTEYYGNLNMFLDVCDGEILAPIKNMASELDGVKHKFDYIGDFDPFYIAQILPLIRSALSKLDEDAAKSFAQSFDLFISSYKKMVAYECSVKTKVALKEQLSGCSSTIQSCALNFLHNIDDIDYILVGLRKPSYVADVL